MAKKKKKHKKKSHIDWIQIVVEIVAGLFTGIILMIIDRLLN
ncbi:F0F1-type ATP synthase assembly protein I [Aequitasia blattaphilus]|nr:hypothetical protein [Aequitasia blattaphilus]